MNGFSKIGFILAALGSSIGLGHIWRFPYVIADNGGGAFVLLFLILLFFIGVVILIAEMLVGNVGRGDAVVSYGRLDPTRSQKWYMAGFTLFASVGILSFYSIVLGWVVYYTFFVSFNLPHDVGTSVAGFGHLIGYAGSWQLVGFLVVVLITVCIISCGVEKGIERCNMIFMPLLFVIFVGLVIYSMKSDYFTKSITYLFDFKIEKVTTKTFVDALGQVFFSLSLGSGIMISYAASGPENQNLFKSSSIIALSGLAISLIAGIMIFTFVFEHTDGIGQQGVSLSGPGLVFETLPAVFHDMGTAGSIVSFLFFLTLGFAGITSTISLLEPPVMYCVSRFNVSRKFASFSVGCFVSVIGTIVMFTQTKGYKFLNMTFWDWLDFLCTNVFLSLGGLLLSIFVGWVIDKDKLRVYCKNSLVGIGFEVWYIIIRYIAPVVIISIMVTTRARAISVMTS